MKRKPAVPAPDLEPEPDEKAKNPAEKLAKPPKDKREVIIAPSNGMGPDISLGEDAV